jgi:NADH-quinone oxidoreductase subunit G
MESKESMTINGIAVEINGEKSIFALIRKAGIEVFTFCDGNDAAENKDCWMCMVETESGGLEYTCASPPRPGLIIKTDTPEIRERRRVLMKLLLSDS